MPVLISIEKPHGSERVEVTCWCALAVGFKLALVLKWSSGGVAGFEVVSDSILKRPRSSAGVVRNERPFGLERTVMVLWPLELFCLVSYCHSSSLTWLSFRAVAKTRLKRRPCRQRPGSDLGPQPPSPFCWSLIHVCGVASPAPICPSSFQGNPWSPSICLVPFRYNPK